MDFTVKNELIEFSKEQIAGKAKVEMPLTHDDIETIMVNGIESGIGYWACLNNVGEDWEDKPKDIPSSQWATKLLLEGKGVSFEEKEGGKEHTLTLEKLIKGFEQNYKERSWDNDLEKGDATTADCIIQYALFDKLVYG